MNLTNNYNSTTDPYLIHSLNYNHFNFEFIKLYSTWYVHLRVEQRLFLFFPKLVSNPTSHLWTEKLINIKGNFRTISPATVSVSRLWFVWFVMRKFPSLLAVDKYLLRNGMCFWKIVIRESSKFVSLEIREKLLILSYLRYKN